MSFFNIFLKLQNNNNFLYKNNPKVLEVGCGNGNDVRNFIEGGLNIIGIDVEFKQGPHIEKLIKEKRILPIEVNAIRKDVGNTNTKYIWPIEDESMDFIISSSVIEHVANMKDFAKESQRTLRDGGYIVHYYPSRFSLIEAHVGIPFGGVLRNRSYIRLMHTLGLCKRKFRARKFTDILEYLENFTFYRQDKELIDIFCKSGFTFVSIDSKSIIEVKALRLRFFSKLPFFNYLFKLLRSKVLIMQKKKIEI